MMRLLRAETRKLSTVWSTYVIAGIVVLIDVLAGVAFAFAPSGRHGGTAGIVPRGSLQWFGNVFSVLDTARLLALVLGAIIITGEYRHKTVTPTFLAEPRRGRVITSKLVASFGGGLLLGLITMLTGLVIGFVFVGVGFHSCVTFSGVNQGMSHAVCGLRQGVYYSASVHTMLHDWWRIAPGVVLGTGLFGLYGLGLGALLKNQVTAIVVGLIFTLVIESIVGAIWPTIGEYLPGQAATALENAARSTVSNTSLLPWWGGAIMLVIYGVALAAVGTLTTVRSDVT